MKHIRYFLSVTAMLCFVLPGTMLAQSAFSFDMSPPPDPTEGKIQDNYVIHQSLEMGWQQTSLGGNQGTYDTFVNLNTGFRLFDQTLDMRSLNHKGGIFDTFWASSFGYGGDPDNATRVRMSKNKWYDFNASFRRDYQRWDYDLWGNPLNPPNIRAAGTPNPAFPMATALYFSPHLLDTVRRNSDFNLTLLPQSRVSFRVGYNRTVLEGPDLTSIHGFADASLYDYVRGIQDTYHFGVDVRAIPRTTISYTQFIQNFKENSTTVDQNLAQVYGFNTPFARSLYNPLATPDPVTGTTQVDIGLPINVFANQPCASPFTGTPLRANPTCSTYTFYGSGSIVNGVLVNPGPRTNPVANFFPTEQFSVQSNYFKNVDFVAHAAYSNSQVDWSWNELGVGLGRGPTGSTVRTDQLAGPGANNRVDVNLDGAITWRITDRVRVSDTFLYNNFRLPGSWNETETTFAGVTNSLNSALVASPVVALSAISNYLDMKVKSNLADVAVDLTRRFGGHIGYRYSDRRWSDRDFLNGALQSTGFVPIHENSGMLGLWAHPRHDLRMNLDLEVMTSSPGNCSTAQATAGLCRPGQATITRLSPDHLQHYNFRTRWTPQPWLTLTGSVNILESRDNQSASSVVSLPINFQHNRNYGFAATISKSSNWSVDFGYNYSDIFSTTNVCFLASPAVPGLAAGGSCPADMASQSAATSILNPSNYSDLTHDGYVNGMLKPFKRVTFTAGYDIMSVSGNGLLLGAFTNPCFGVVGCPVTSASATVPLSTLGTQNYIYHRPSLGMNIELSKELSWKTNWRYYDYNEGSQNPFAPTLARNFTGHVVDLALRYAF